jgi:hypothetical protein
MISTTLYGRFGNQLWQYAVCRTVAEKRGYSFHINREFQNYFNCDLGESIEIIDKYFPSQNNYDHIQKYDERIFDIEDGTKLDGFHQSEKYILDNRDNILNWFNPPDHIKLRAELDQNTCVINFRGGDYKTINHVFLNKKFYYDSIQKMLQINNNMKFIVVTDDPPIAYDFFPEYKIYHFNIMEDFLIVNKALYLIIANSTFSWWAAWLNQNAKLIIAPKYWMRYNISKGWWSPSDSLTTRFNYIDRDANFQTYDECLSEIDINYNYLDHYNNNYDL